MKYKIKDDCEKPALRKRVMGKHDWVLWYGEERCQCIQIQGLFRNVSTNRVHANCIDENGNYLRHEQLTFQSRKAAYRYIVRHAKDIIDEYWRRNQGRICHFAMATTWRNSRQKQVIVNLRKLYNKNNNGKRSNN